VSYLRVEVREAEVDGVLDDVEGVHVDGRGVSHLGVHRAEEVPAAEARQTGPKLHKDLATPIRIEARDDSRHIEREAATCNPPLSGAVVSRYYCKVGPRK
jgi:hypothetical protein